MILRVIESERSNNQEYMLKLKDLTDENEILKMKNVNLKLALEQTVYKFYLKNK